MRPGAINRHGGRPFRTRVLFLRLFAFFFLTIKSKRRKKKIKKRSTWVLAWLAKRKEEGFYHQLLTEISLVNISAFSELLRMTRLSCRVAYTDAISTILLPKFQFWRLFSRDFFTCRVASSRVATRAIFISRWRRDKV